MESLSRGTDAHSLDVNDRPAEHFTQGDAIPIRNQDTILVDLCISHDALGQHLLHEPDGVVVSLPKAGEVNTNRIPFEGSTSTDVEKEPRHAPSGIFGVSNSNNGKQFPGAPLETQSEPYAAATTDHTGCEHVGPVDRIESVAASGANGPTDVVYLYSGPAPQTHVSVPKGWKLVPETPTVEMECAPDHEDCATPDAARATYLAMLSKAPPSPLDIVTVEVIPSPQTLSRVKPLEWRKGYCDERVTIHQASNGWLYQIRILDGVVWLDWPDRAANQFHSEKEAKEVAQTDYERRVLALLADSTSSQTHSLESDPATLRGYCQQLLDMFENYGVEIEGEDNDLIAHISRNVDPAYVEPAALDTEGKTNG